MKKLNCLLVVVFLLVAVAAFAVWNPIKQENFFGRLRNLAFQMQDTREECARLVAIWFTESVSSNADFVDHPSGVTTGEMTNMITQCQDFTAFYGNVAVAPSNRRVRLDPFLSSVSP